MTTARLLPFIVAAAILAGCSTPTKPPSGTPARTPSGATPGATIFVEWRAANAAQVAAFEAYLRLEGVDRLVPLNQLLRTAASWQNCGGSPFEVPPEHHWPDAAAVLRLVRTLKDQGILGDFEVHSGYRNASINACAGGAPRSAHFKAFAVDFRPNTPANAASALCAFWREQGRDWNMGFGRYPSGLLHIDVSGYRAWGSDGKLVKAGSCPAVG